MSYKDCFSTQSDSYRRFRPGYPEELFQYLADLCQFKQLAWDCATGNGQAATALAPFFDRVAATDASPEQIARAETHEKIDYSVATAENSGLAETSVDLITVANAVHWFDIPAFYNEAKRVMRDNAVIAVWCYETITPKSELAEALAPLHSALHDYWQPNLQHVWSHYKELAFPFEEIASPEFFMSLDWKLDEYLGFVSSWSSVQA